MAKLIELEVPRTKAEKFFTNPPGRIEINGTLEKGKFKGLGVEASYVTSDHNNGTLRLSITIEKKPLIVSMGMIENMLNTYLSEEVNE